MIKIETRITTAAQSPIVMPTYTFGEVACAHIDAPARKRAFDALAQGASTGAPAWSPPPR